MLADIPVSDQPDRNAMTAGAEAGPVDELAEGDPAWNQSSND